MPSQQSNPDLRAGAPVDLAQFAYVRNWRGPVQDLHWMTCPAADGTPDAAWRRTLALA
jgi:hypothetical protein